MEELMELMDPVVHLDPQAFQGTRGLEWPLRQAGAPRAGGCTATVERCPELWRALAGSGGLWWAGIGLGWSSILFHRHESDGAATLDKTMQGARRSRQLLGRVLFVLLISALLLVGCTFGWSSPSLSLSGRTDALGPITASQTLAFSLCSSSSSSLSLSFFLSFSLSYLSLLVLYCTRLLAHPSATPTRPRLFSPPPAAPPASVSFSPALHPARRDRLFRLASAFPRLTNLSTSCCSAAAAACLTNRASTTATSTKPHNSSQPLQTRRGSTPSAPVTD